MPNDFSHFRAQVGESLAQHGPAETGIGRELFEVFGRYLCQGAGAANFHRQGFGEFGQGQGADLIIQGGHAPRAVGVEEREIFRVGIRVAGQCREDDRIEEAEDVEHITVDASTSVGGFSGFTSLRQANQ